MQIRQKINRVVNHPAAGLVTMVAVSAASIVVAHYVGKKIEASIPAEEAVTE